MKFPTPYEWWSNALPPGQEKASNARGMAGGDVEASICLVHKSTILVSLRVLMMMKVYFRVHSLVLHKSLNCIWQIFLFAQLNLLNVLISISKKFFDSNFPSLCFDVPKASNVTSARPKTGDWEWLWRHFRTSSFTKNRFLSHFLIVSLSIC